jgi:hypothetical protein
MKKVIYLLFVAALALTLKGPNMANAATTSFLVSATIPVASGASITASRVSSTTLAFTPVAGTNLSFDPMTFNAPNGIYLPDHFFAIDVGAVGGAGAPDVVVTYTEGANPNSPNPGLGDHSAATFVRIQGTTEVPLTSHGPKKLLSNVVGEHITTAETAGGFLRIYAGIVTGDASTPAGGIPFTNADQPGAYNGTLVVTATVP